MYNPWVGGGPQYAFGRQPQAAAVNLAGLAPSFIELVQLVGTKEGLSKAERDAAVDEIRDAVQMGYVDTFHAKVRVRVRARVRARVRVRVRVRVPRRPPQLTLTQPRQARRQLPRQARACRGTTRRSSCGTRSSR